MFLDEGAQNSPQHHDINIQHQEEMIYYTGHELSDQVGEPSNKGVTRKAIIG